MVDPQRVGGIGPTARSLRDAIRSEYGDQCFYCGRKGSHALDPDGRAWQLDHVYPLSRGGPNRLWNLALACAHCNNSKWAYTGDGFTRYRLERDRAVASWWIEKPTERPAGHAADCRCGTCSYVALKSHEVPALSPNPETGRVED